MDKLLYTVTETAYLLNCSTSKVYKLIAAGKIRCIRSGKIYLINIKDIKAYTRSLFNQCN